MDALTLLQSVPIFANASADELASLAQQGQFVQLASGECLYRENDPPRHFFILASGRLQASHGGLILGHISRLEVVGEMGVVAAQVRNATVHALRDSLLLSFKAADIMAFLRVQPEVLLALTRLVIERGRDYQNLHRPSATRLAGTLAIVPAVSHLPSVVLAEMLTEYLRGWPVTRLITSAHVDNLFGAGFAQTPLDDSENDQRLRRWLNDLENKHDYLVFAADNDHDTWSLRCLRQADRILILGEANSPPDDVPVLQALQKNGLVTPVELVLLRPEGDPSPHTHAWTEATGARAHYFLHPWSKPELAALARQLSGRGIGLVLGGGGARGFAHIGLIRALEQLQIPVDVVGGTSMGAFIGALVACGFDSVEMEHIAHETFVARNYLNDYTMPRVSLIRGERFHERLVTIFGERRIEDLRRSYYCISTNLTTGHAGVHGHGPLASWVGTSMCVPGVAPPIAFEGDLLCDGGVVNNLPTDVMQNLERGLIIACNVSSDGDIRALGAGMGVPDQAALLNWKGNDPAPSWTEILMRTATLTSDTITQKASIERADVYLRMPIADFGMFDWEQMELLIQRGHEHALQVLTPLRDRLLNGSGQFTQ